MLQLVIDGLFVGSFYALVALGYSMVYGIIKLLNFAHGDVYMIGAFTGFVVFSGITGLAGAGVLGILLVVLIAMILTGILGVVVERVAYRPLRKSPRLAVLITAVGMSFILEYGIRQIFGPNPQVYPARLEGESLQFLDGRITVPQIVLMIVAGILMFALNLYIMRSRDGRAMRAIALDPTAAQLMGVNVNSVISRTFFIGSALAGAAGVMAGAYYGTIDFLMGFVIGLKAFTAAVIGGIGNLYGAMLGGLVLGLLESLGTHFLGGQWRDVFSFACLILFLSLRPTGILGARVVERM